MCNVHPLNLGWACWLALINRRQQRSSGIWGLGSRISGSEFYKTLSTLQLHQNPCPVRLDQTLVWLPAAMFLEWPLPPLLQMPAWEHSTCQENFLSVPAKPGIDRSLNPLLDKWLWKASNDKSFLCLLRCKFTPQNVSSGIRAVSMECKHSGR